MFGNKKRDDALAMMLANMVQMAKCDDAMPRHVIVQNTITDLHDRGLLPDTDRFDVYLQKFDR